MRRSHWIIPLVLGLLAAGLLFMLLHVQHSAAVSLTPTASPQVSATPMPPAVLIFAADGRPSEMYSDLYGIYQLYLSTDLNAPLTGRDGHAFEPAWSPDGTRIAYTYRELDLPQTYIEVMDVDGSNRQRLTHGGTDTSPVWSPDGSQVAFISHRDGDTGLVYVMNADGSDVRLLRDGVDASSLAWSPDGRQLAVTSRHLDGTHVYLMDADGSNLHRLLKTSESAWDAIWSPDGSTIAYVRTDGIYLTGDEGCTSRRLELTGFYTYFLEDGFSARMLTWSPDGTQLAFSVHSWKLRIGVSTPVPYERVWSQIMTANVTTGETDLITYGFDNIDPDWQFVPRP
jgi:Tol biopolymer transport system component